MKRLAAASLISVFVQLKKKDEQFVPVYYNLFFKSTSQRTVLEKKVKQGLIRDNTDPDPLLLVLKKSLNLSLFMK